MCNEPPNQRVVAFIANKIIVNIIFLSSSIHEDCELPGDPKHGKAHVSGTTQGSQVNYTCDRGYRINGTSSRTCGPDGTWGGREPTCEGQLP